jgi:hypothetical protein
MGSPKLRIEQMDSAQDVGEDTAVSLSISGKRP